MERTVVMLWRMTIIFESYMARTTRYILIVDIKGEPVIAYSQSLFLSILFYNRNSNDAFSLNKITLKEVIFPNEKSSSTCYFYIKTEYALLFGVLLVKPDYMTISISRLHIIHWFHKDLSTYYILGAAQEAGNKAVNKTKSLLMVESTSCPHLGLHVTCVQH